MSLKIGIIGLDTSHVERFAETLNDSKTPSQVPKGEISVAYPGGSNDFALSYNRVGKYTDLLTKKYGVEMVDDPEQVADKSDAILIASVDGRVHLDQFQRIAPYGKPVFIDKPFSINTSSAKKIIELSEQYNVPLMSCSPLRYDESLTEGIQNSNSGSIIGADCYGPMELQQTQPGLYWYGIHAVEMLYTILGSGCKTVYAYANDTHELVIGEWKDGRIGTVRGNRVGNKIFGSSIHRENGTQFTASSKSKKSYHVNLHEKILKFMETGRTDVDINTTLEIIRFIEAANESRDIRKAVKI